ncbi:MAG: hypothetical protein Aurels2KO_52390 [Aureliella sp.]
MPEAEQQLPLEQARAVNARNVDVRYRKHTEDRFRELVNRIPDVYSSASRADVQRLAANE